MTGHSYIVYGPLANRATSMMYEGAPNFPDFDRLWQIIEDYKVTIFYTAPTAIRTFMKWGDHHVGKHDLSSLRLIGTVGEPINPEAWIWYQANIGSGRCPIVDTWWQTETGAIMITPLARGGPDQARLAPPSPSRGYSPQRLSIENGESRSRSDGGGLTRHSPSRGPRWPRTIYGDDQRYRRHLLGRGTRGRYLPGRRRAKRDGAEEGYFWTARGGSTTSCWMSRAHRLGTPEVETALVSSRPRSPRPLWLVAKTS